VDGVWPVAEVRAAEEALLATLPEGALMRRAAYGLAVHCARLCARGVGTRRVYGARVVLLVGAGNNGGDALYAGATLARWGAHVIAVLLDPDRAHAGGVAELRAARGWVVPAGGRSADEAVAALSRADLVVDGIVGIGGRGGLRPAAASLAEVARESGAVRVAVDVPSGVDSDTGAVAGAAFEADVTVTFGCYKPGLVVGPGAVTSGRVVLVDIGLAPYLPWPDLAILTVGDLPGLVPVPGPADDKYTRGVVGVAAGSAGYTGAGLLTVGAAVHGPAGMVRYVGAAADLVRSRHPEVVVADGLPSRAGRVQAWVVGPGLGTDAAAREILDDVLASDVPVVVDADGITLLAATPDALAQRAAPSLITPHDRELARIAGFEPGEDRLGVVRRAARRLGCAVLLKGDATLVARPDGTAYVDRCGTPWLATAGSGDVLAGMIGALLAAWGGRGGGAGPDVALAAAAGTYVHGVAGELAAEHGVPTAADVLAAVPAAYRRAVSSPAPR